MDNVEEDINGESILRDQCVKNEEHDNQFLKYFDIGMEKMPTILKAIKGERMHEARLLAITI